MEHQPWMDSGALPPHYDDLPVVPDYSCTVRLTGNFLCKQELEAPRRAAACRSWSRVQAELRGTLLIIRSYRGDASTTDSRSYTLQAADAGLAADYYRRSHVLRVRAEGYQFLLAAASLSIVIDWVDKLNAAMAVSSPLEDRRESRYLTLPPSAKPSLASVALVDRTWRSVREGWCQSRKQRMWLEEPQQYLQGQQPCPALPPRRRDPTGADTARNQSSKGSRLMDRRSSSASCPCAHCWAPNLQAHSWSVSSTPVSQLAYFPISPPLTRESSLDTVETSTPRSSISEWESKWEPKPIISTAGAKLDYAKRCARVLTYASPWVGTRYVRDGRTIIIRKSAATRTGAPVASRGH